MDGLDELEKPLLSEWLDGRWRLEPGERMDCAVAAIASASLAAMQVTMGGYCSLAESLARWPAGRRRRRRRRQTTTTTMERQEESYQLSCC